MLGLFAVALVGASTIVAQRAAVADDNGIHDSGGDGSEQAIVELSAELKADTNGQVRVSIDPDTGLVSLIGAPAGKSLTESTEAPPDQIATGFLADYAPMFGVNANNLNGNGNGNGNANNGNDLVVDRIVDGLDGTAAVRFQQQVGGVPVVAGEVAVQVDADGRVVSASGESSPAVDIDTSPMFGADAATTTAIRTTSKLDAVDSTLLSATVPELWIYDPQLIGASEISAPRLVWRIRVDTAVGDVERLVLVDAHDGTIALQFSTRDDVGPARSVCDNANDSSRPFDCTVPVRVEGGPPTSNVDVDSAYDLAGVTYSFYKNVLGRNGIDGNDLPIKSTVNFCSSACPFRNAFWSGDQMVYGAGYAKADDVVAHELTHGVTDYTSKLFYYGESGAINESMSDVFGELIDQLDTTSGPDPVADKWLIGEQLPGGPLRRMDLPNLALPGRAANPDRMTSPLFSGIPKDSHGVHTNSGVGNKAAYLITDGGSFNGQTVTGLGITKTAQIYYQAQTTLLGPGSDYLDLYGALQQACASLVGGPAGITTVDCQQVTKAVTATEMTLAPTTVGARLTAAECQAGAVRGETLFSDDMEAGIGKWVTTASEPAAVWTSLSGSSRSGTKSMHGPDIEVGSPSSSNRSMTNEVRIANSISIPTGNTFLRFEHSFNLEGNTNGTVFYDGGVVEYSTNGVNGPWIDAEALGMINGYSGTLATSSGGVTSTNPFRGRRAFSDTSPGYQQTRIDLSS
ncbi:MAG: M4 family metallopeptidase, partial [Ilumatobacteraceae bacterium]